MATNGKSVRDVWVVDCSAFVPIVFADEDAVSIEALLSAADQERLQIVVPTLFWYEVSNVLRMAVIRNRISQEEAEGALFRFTGLPFDTDAELPPAVVLRIGRFASEKGLTAYDAAYFELAERRSARLLTFDKALLALAPECPWICSSSV